MRDTRVSISNILAAGHPIHGAVTPSPRPSPSLCPALIARCDVAPRAMTGRTPGRGRGYSKWLSSSPEANICCEMWHQKHHVASGNCKRRTRALAARKGTCTEDAVVYRIVDHHNLSNIVYIFYNSLYYLIISFLISFTCSFFLKFFLKCNQNCLKNAGNPRDMRRFQVGKNAKDFANKYNI